MRIVLTVRTLSFGRPLWARGVALQGSSTSSMLPSCASTGDFYVHLAFFEQSTPACWLLLTGTGSLGLEPLVSSFFLKPVTCGLPRKPGCVKPKAPCILYRVRRASGDAHAARRMPPGTLPDLKYQDVSDVCQTCRTCVGRVGPRSRTCRTCPTRRQQGGSW